MRLTRDDLVRGTLGLALIAQGALCHRLWLTGRTFPAIPVISGLPTLSDSLTVWLSILLVGAIGAFVAMPRSRWPVFAALGTAGVLVLFDIDRLQPWLYFDAWLLLAFTGKDPKTLVRVLVVTLYFWSGIQKLNLGFATRVFPAMLHPLGLDRAAPIWFLVPLAEIAIAFLLFVPRTRFYGICLAVLIHGLTLVDLASLGRDANSVVWPWNFEMPVLAFAVFFRNDEPLFPAAWSSGLGKAALAITGIMPALSFFGWWDDYLSASLYSGTSADAFLLFSEAGAAKIPPNIQPYIQRRPDRIGIDVTRWALTDLNVPPYPEIRVYRALARRLAIAPPDMTLLVVERKGLTSTHAEVKVVPF